MQLRISIADETAEPLVGLRPVMRSHFLNCALESVMQGIKPEALIAARRDMIRLGTLINQSLRITQGKIPDVEAVREGAELITKLTRK